MAVSVSSYEDRTWATRSWQYRDHRYSPKTIPISGPSYLGRAPCRNELVSGRRRVLLARETSPPSSPLHQSDTQREPGEGRRAVVRSEHRATHDPVRPRSPEKRSSNLSARAKTCTSVRGSLSSPSTGAAARGFSRPLSRNACDRRQPSKQGESTLLESPCSSRLSHAPAQVGFQEPRQEEGRLGARCTAPPESLTPPKVERRKGRREQAQGLTCRSKLAPSGQAQLQFGQTSTPAKSASVELSGRAICPTPHYLHRVLARGERELPNWHGARDGTELLGNCAAILMDTAQFLLDVAGSAPPTSTLSVLSLADGIADDKMPEWQARYVPTSVMLCHAFAMIAESLKTKDRPVHVRVFGGDLRNAVSHWREPQRFLWPLPSWLNHRFVALDNKRDFVKQIFDEAQCERGRLFDVVIVRQGLCFCDDPSKLSLAWPREVLVSSVAYDSLAGTYQLEAFLHEGRPAYRRGHCVLKWLQDRGEWVICDAQGGLWAYVRSDVGHPAVARGPWAAWNGAEHVLDQAFACDLVGSDPPPWHRSPASRYCCCGVDGTASSVTSLLHRMASVLDVRQFNSFGLLHGAWTNGTKAEVYQLHQQIEEAAQLYNQQRVGAHVSTVLWRKSAKEFWLQCDGLLLFQPGSCVDPFVVNPAP